MRVVISSGHGLYVRGARGLIDEVDEARHVTNRVAEILQGADVPVNVFHENTARSQRGNVNNIIQYHNGQIRDLDVSVHFNDVAGGMREAGIGVEVLYRSGKDKARQIAGRVARAISDASGLILRHQWRAVAGTVPSTAIGFLNNTTAPAILIEVCFVNSRTDVDIYQQHFEEICQAIAGGISGRVITPAPAPTPQPSSWARKAWKWGVGMGFIDDINPQGTPTREQMITLLHRYHEARHITVYSLPMVDIP